LTQDKDKKVKKCSVYSEEGVPLGIKPRILAQGSIIMTSL